ncbi:MAG: M23 family metallopeptidase [Leptospirales bacterium]|nr:M23 family metallopeptidase [Leptospirales bacterium]
MTEPRPGSLPERAASNRLRTLRADEPELGLLREEIAANLRAVSRSGRLERPLRFRRYRLREGDNFYRVMARLSQDPDTLASLNDIVNPNAVGPGDELLIPNARGLFLSGDRKELARRYRLQEDQLVDVAQRYFLPGRRYDPAELSYFRGDGFLPPLSGARLASGFGMRLDPFSHRRTFHGGVDLAAPIGTPVLASREGRVLRAGEAAGYGLLVVLEHQFGYQSYYGHLSRIRVAVGQRLRAGAVLGEVGATGRATGPHLHFEVRRNGVQTRPRLVHGLLLP